MFNNMEAEEIMGLVFIALLIVGTVIISWRYGMYTEKMSLSNYQHVAQTQ